MDTMLSDLEMLNAISPLGVIALLGYIIYLQVKSQKGQHRIATNHLHDLPEMVDTLRRIDEKMDKVIENTSYIRGRINGKDQ